MNRIVRITLTLALTCVATPLLADEFRMTEPARARIAEIQAQRATLLVQDKTTSTTADALPKSATPGLPIVNASRAYPPSCLADPLPDAASGPTYGGQIQLATFDTTRNLYSRETVGVTVWRVACSSSTYFTSATLLRITRLGANNGNNRQYVLFPNIEAAQNNTVNNVNFGDPAGRSFVRVATEPNTVISDALINTPIISSTTFVLENYPYSGAGYFDFNLAFKLRIDNGYTNEYSYVDVPLYSPTAATYPDAFANLPISGYFTTNWGNPKQNGEGMLVQVFELPGERNKLILSFAWFTFDSSRTAFWLFGQAEFTRGARSVTAQTVYVDNGVFAGTTGASATVRPWGNVTIAFPSCQKMSLAWASNTGLPSGVPSGTGSATWERVADVNALNCE